jgi:hypothetical protein
MALIQPKQLANQFYEITGSFTGSFIGDGSGLVNLPTSSFGQLSKISIGDITASVNIGTNIFLITSASSEFFTINNQGSTIISSTADDIFLIKNLNNTPVLTVSQSGVLVLSTQSIELINPAPNGGVYFTSSSFFIGLD